jgi:hypothetical protein
MKFHEACTEIERAGFAYRGRNGRAVEYAAADTRTISFAKIIKGGDASLFAVHATRCEIPEFYAALEDAIRAATEARA